MPAAQTGSVSLEDADKAEQAARILRSEDTRKRNTAAQNWPDRLKKARKESEIEQRNRDQFTDAREKNLAEIASSDPDASLTSIELTQEEENELRTTRDDLPCGLDTRDQQDQPSQGAAHTPIISQTDNGNDHNREKIALTNVLMSWNRLSYKLINLTRKPRQKKLFLRRMLQLEKLSTQWAS
ncbi:hypothetical protein F443_01234 [Phytophthora nicotianae P1569]|uniref:Uncharacterized protein n=1 Tax=Phytophthora nicotianae P1569 TaxID=1317065 RepID=V9FXE0_PHYNI|nr:hypothetical protein F443_01234 [Phytophthora nicotianae P1569]